MQFFLPCGQCSQQEQYLNTFWSQQRHKKGIWDNRFNQRKKRSQLKINTSSQTTKMMQGSLCHHRIYEEHNVHWSNQKIPDGFKGNRIIMVLYEQDGNLILMEPMKSWTLGEMCRAYNIKVTKHIFNKKSQINIYYPQTITEEMLQKKQSACSRTTSKQFLHELTAHSHALMGLIVTASWKHIKHVTSKEHSINNICLCIHEWATQF